MDSAGIRWTPPESARLRQNPPESARIRWTPPESAGLCWNPPDSAGQVHWTLSGRILQIPAESSDFRWIPVDSLQTGHVNLAHVTLTKSGIWVRRNPPESDRSCGGVYSPPYFECLCTPTTVLYHP